MVTQRKHSSVGSVTETHHTAARQSRIGLTRTDALRTLREQSLKAAVVRQYTTPLTPQQQAEQTAWGDILDVAVDDMLTRELGH